MLLTRRPPVGSSRVSAAHEAVMTSTKPADFLPDASFGFRYLEKSNPRTSGLQFLTYGVYELTCGSSGALAHPEEEALLFCWKGSATARLDGNAYQLESYDVLYIPR